MGIFLITGTISGTFSFRHMPEKACPYFTCLKKPCSIFILNPQFVTLKTILFEVATEKIRNKLVQSVVISCSGNCLLLVITNILGNCGPFKSCIICACSGLSKNSDRSTVFAMILSVKQIKCTMKLWLLF